MKNFSLTLGVCSAIIGCTLAFAVTEQGPKSLLNNSGKCPKEAFETISPQGDSEDVKRIKENPTIDEKSIARAQSTRNQEINLRTCEAEQDEELITVNLWETAPQIKALSTGASYDASTNTLSFPGSQNLTQYLFAGVSEDGKYYNWFSVAGREYVFSGKLTSNDDASVLVCIIYRDSSTGNFTISSQAEISLTEDNSYTQNFLVTTSSLPTSAPMAVAFLPSDSDAATVITSSENSLCYSFSAKGATPWSPETDLPGLGLREDLAGMAYTYKCDDGVTTLGLVMDDHLYVTGINTSATEVVFPDFITIEGLDYQIYGLGYYNEDGSDFIMDWTAATSVTSLDLGFGYYLNVDFSETSITDLYIKNNFYIDDNLSGQTNIYLHVSYDLASYRNILSECGFKRVLVGEETPDYPESQFSDWVIAGENEGTYFGIITSDYGYIVQEIFTANQSVAIPLTTKAEGGEYYIRGVGIHNEYCNTITDPERLCRYAENLKSLIIPEGVINLGIIWSYNGIRELHMAGSVPETPWTLPNYMTVYVMDQSTFQDYDTASGWTNASILPEGWDFDWLTVNVAKPGEFAQTYLELTNSDWSSAINMKVLGSLSSTDLDNMKNLNQLRCLDLSESVIYNLTSGFMYRNKSLVEINLPETLLTIPSQAFSDCIKLRKVTAPGVVNILDLGFGNCEKLIEFDLSNVESIGNNCFCNCLNFNPTLNGAITNIGQFAFTGTAIEEVSLSEGIRSLGTSAFAECTRLKKVTLPSTLKTIDAACFSGCSNLIEVNLSHGLTTIAARAFENCLKLPEIILPASLEDIGDKAFFNCEKLLNVKCKAIVPPQPTGIFTTGMDLAHCVLQVATFTIDTYRGYYGWNKFNIIKPLNEPIDELLVYSNLTLEFQEEDSVFFNTRPNLVLDYRLFDNDYYNKAPLCGQLTVRGNTKPSFGIFQPYNILSQRGYSEYENLRPSLIVETTDMRADSVVTTFRCEPGVWHFVSFPYEVKVSDISGWNNTDFAVRSYNGSSRALGESGSNWEDVPADGILEAGKGYILQCANNTGNEQYSYYATVDFPSRNTISKNRIFTSGNVTVPLEEYPSEFSHNRSWNLVGNPYPCYYHMQYVTDTFTSPVTIWRGSSYQAYSPIDDDIILRPYEAFFVQCPVDKNEIVFEAAGRLHYDDTLSGYDNPSINHAPGNKIADESRNVFNFIVHGDGTDDRARIVFNENASRDYEVNRDASKFFAENATGMEIFVNDNLYYGICERPYADGEAILGVKIGKKGTFTLSLTGKNTEGWTVLVTDTKTGETVDLTSSSYTFDADPGNDTERFTLTFKSPVLVSVEDITDFSYNKNVKILSVAGFTIFEGDINEFKLSDTSGVFIIIQGDKTYKIVKK